MSEQKQTVEKKPKAKSESPKIPQISLPPDITVKQLADLLKVNAIEIIKQLMRNGVMVNINQSVDFNIAAAIAEVYGFKAVHQPAAAKSKASISLKGEKLVTRPPVITIMGHVDHGKTSLLDAIRQSNVVATEAGAITQHIGAYQVVIDGRKITFLDTPGHEAFTSMRARGAQSTDIAVIVVAADDGVMPQTEEAIHHAQAAGVPIVIALNKIDKANANPDKIKQQLADHDLLVEDWGGKIGCIPVSAKKKEGIKELLEYLLLVADMAELKAKIDGPAEGVIIESKMDKARGPLATLLVQKGTLKIGDIIVVSGTYGKIKAMFNDTGKPVKQAGPATPVEVLGIGEVVAAGEVFKVARDEHDARVLMEKQKDSKKAFSSTTKSLSLSDFSEQVSAGQAKELNIILKTDVQGSIEPIKDSLEQLGTQNVKVRIIHASSGRINENDVNLALASNGIIVGFNSKPEAGAQRLADMEKVSIRFYNVIYDLIGDVDKALKGLLEPTYREVIEGQAEVRAVFDTGNKNKAAGVLVKEGKISRDLSARVIRKNEIIHKSRVNSLKRFKNDVREVATGMECGVGLEGFNGFEIGDIIQFYKMEKVI